MGSPQVVMDRAPVRVEATATNPRREQHVSPLDAVPAGSPGASALAGAGAVVVHLALGIMAMLVGARVVKGSAAPTPVTVAEVVEVDLPPLPPAPASSREPDRLPPTPRAPTPVVRRQAPPAAAAQAGKVLAASDEIVDFEETVVDGGTGYAGGVTEAGGSVAHAVRDPGARAGGVQGGTGAEPLADRSRAPRLAGGVEWDCPFPAEADDAGLEHAIVPLRVEIAVDGQVLSVSATSDPGHGFVREALRCASDKGWTPGLDHAGHPTRAVAFVNVRFDR